MKQFNESASRSARSRPTVLELPYRQLRRGAYSLGTTGKSGRNGPLHPAIRQCSSFTARTRCSTREQARPCSNPPSIASPPGSWKDGPFYPRLSLPQLEDARRYLASIPHRADEPDAA